LTREAKTLPPKHEMLVQFKIGGLVTVRTGMPEALADAHALTLDEVKEAWKDAKENGVQDAAYEVDTIWHSDACPCRTKR
jgi:hypothetical protein